MRDWVGVMTSWPGILLRQVALGVIHKNHATSRVQVSDQSRISIAVNDARPRSAPERRIK